MVPKGAPKSFLNFVLDSKFAGGGMISTEEESEEKPRLAVVGLTLPTRVALG